MARKTIKGLEAIIMDLEKRVMQKIVVKFF